MSDRGTVLAIDTSTARSTAGVVRVTGRAVEVLAERHADDGKKHGELLAGLVDAALAAAGIGVADLDAVVVGAGPGPFTGLRVGIVSASVIASLRGISVYGVGSLDAIAAVVDVRPLVVAADARRREVYWARYEPGASTVEPTVGPAVEVDRAGATVTGAGAALYPDALGTSLGADHPTAAGLVHCALDRLVHGAPSEVVEPRYLRRPDAVEPTGRKRTVQR